MDAFFQHVHDLVKCAGCSALWVFFFFFFLCILMLGILQISAVGTLENSNWCIATFKCMYSCMQVCTCFCIYVASLGWWPAPFSTSLFSIHWDNVLLLNPELTHVATLVSHFAPENLCLQFLITGITTGGLLPSPGSYMGSGNPNSNPHACTARFTFSICRSITIASEMSSQAQCWWCPCRT